MGIAAIIAGSIVVISVIAIIGETIQASMKNKAKLGEGGGADVKALKERLALLEARFEEREGSLLKLQEELRFMTRMLEDKTGSRSN